MNQSSEDKKPKIFIGGDSFGCGEWDESSTRVVHLGLEQYFKDSGYQVINSSKGGSSNAASIARLIDSLDKSFVENDIVFWIQSDCLRELRPFTNISSLIIKANGLAELVQQITEKDYATLNSAAVKFDTKIHLIGGIQDIMVSSLTNFSNLNAIVPSWIYMLVGHFEEYQDLFPHHLHTEEASKYITLKVIRDLKLFYRVLDVLYKMERSWILYREDAFRPDKIHPNRDGHRILFDYLVKELSL